MTGTTTDLRDRLPRVDEAAATLRSAAIAAFNGQEVGDGRVTARAWTGGNSPNAWLRFETGEGPIHIAPLIVAGTLARVSRPDGGGDAVAAAASLVELEPLIALIEEALGLPLHAQALDERPTTDAVLIDLALEGTDRSVRQRVLATFPRTLASHPIAPRPVPLPPGLGLPWRATIAGPKLTPEEAGTVAIGDLLLLGTFVSAAQLFLPGRRSAAAASVDLSQYVIRIDALDLEGGMMLDETQTAPSPLSDDATAQAPATPIRTGATLATTIELPGGTIRAAELATLAPGSLLPIPGQGGTLSVRVSVDGQPIADGELVAIGQGYGVIVSALPPVRKP